MEASTILVFDYCGLCTGTCTICALSDVERSEEKPFLTRAQLVEGVRKGAEAAKGRNAGHFVLGIGRGNTLALGPDSVGDIVAAGKAAEEAFSFGHADLEISTSLMGKLERHVSRAHEILDAVEAGCPTLDPRFVVVGNLGLKAEKYWSNLLSFLDAMAERRGGGDGSGDILLLNLPLGAMPGMDWIEATLGRLKSPVNVTWSPVYDPLAKDPDALGKLEEWLDDYHRTAERLGMDSSLQERARRARVLGAADEDDLSASADENGAALMFVDSKGRLHSGYSSVLGDLDPVRFPTGAAGERGEGLGMAGNPAQERARMLRHRACRGCAGMAHCLRAGGGKPALMMLDALKAHPDVCPTGLRRLFERTLRHAA